MTIGSILAATLAVTVAVAIAMGAWQFWRRDRPRAIRIRDVELGQFTVAPWEGVQLAGDASFHIEWSRDAGGPAGLVGVARDGAHTTRQPLDQFPLRTARLEIERIATGRQLTFAARERIADDEAFTVMPRDGAPGPVLVPLRPSSWSWEGIRIRAPRVLHYQRSTDRPRLLATGPRKPVARLLIAGVYMARQATLRAAVSDWAFSAGKSPLLVLRDVESGAEICRATVDRIHAENQAVVDGLSVSPAMPSRPPAVPDDDSRREGAPFVVDLGFYLKPRSAPWNLAVHAELGPLRSSEVVIRVLP